MSAEIENLYPVLCLAQINRHLLKRLVPESEGQCNYTDNENRKCHSQRDD